MQLPQRFHAEAIDELHTQTVAKLRGPVLYARLETTQPSFVPFYKIQNETYTLYHQQEPT
jgi:hypothetical protein